MSNDTPSAEDKARYDAARKELNLALAKKRTLDKQLSQLEVQIYNLETSYLTETAAHSGGNIIHGFDGYLKNQPSGRRKYEISEQDRIFSVSSLTYRKALELSGEGEESTATGEDQSRMSTPGLTTISVPPAPRTEVLSAAQQKKNRDREYQRKKRAAQRRSTTTPASDDESVSGRKPSKRARLADED
ncbi:NuA4-domain-containing protein [Dichomitus squalens]|uniref:Chromatin modification-related protein EAF6 n=1 Tax=Dichomitus squalens TaxID=114155 RepID=A0A4Q9MW10_9APHY|nr:NuA4-domain-containing protein [Dichomitus squalens]TBU38189.1 NuA4-domain-containing protein [Dichomitus squalens]TBU56552.1 NuA4-domain-containing protein [Dichomitus squalens]